MKKKSIFSFAGLVCALVAAMFVFSGCGATTISASEWMKQANNATRNWYLVGEAKDTVQSRTIVYTETEKEYDFEHKVWEENTTNYTIIRDGYGADRKYYVKTVEKNIAYDEDEDVNALTTTVDTKEAYIGKVEDDSWMFYEYVHDEDGKPSTPTTTEVVATTAENYETYLNAEGNSIESSACYAFFGSSSDSLEEHLSQNIANIEDFGSMELLIYINIFDMNFTKNGNEYKISYTMENLLGLGVKNTNECVIKDGKFSTWESIVTSNHEALNDEGDIEVVAKVVQSAKLTISYKGTVTMPVLTTPPV